MATSEEDVCTLIRLALACEASKKPLRREDILSLVLGGSSRRSLKTLLAEANQRLAADFAMQLVPLPAASRPLSTATVAGRKAASAMARQQRDSSSGSSSYILISKGRRSPNFTYHRRPEQLAHLTIILCLIALSGGEIEEEALRERLVSLAPPPSGLNELIGEWRRQRYLTIGKRIDDQAITVYSAGPRALLEFPPEHLAGFIMDLFTRVSDVSGEERVILAARLKATLQVQSITSDGADDGDDEGEADAVRSKDVKGNNGNNNSNNNDDRDRDEDVNEDDNGDEDEGEGEEL